MDDLDELVDNLHDLVASGGFMALPERSLRRRYSMLVWISASIIVDLGIYFCFDFGCDVCLIVVAKLAENFPKL